jgi:hypothetical protein
MASEEQTQTLSLKAAYAFGAANGLEKEIAAIRDMVIEWDLSYGSSLRRGYIVELFEKHGLMEKFKATHWSVGNTPLGASKRKRYLRIKAQYEDFLAGRGTETSIESEDEDEGSDGYAFAAEADLRDFLAKHPDCIEAGLKLYRSGEKTGIEYAVDGGFIDLLCVDSSGTYVVVELKLGRGRNKAIGQLLYYMGWIDKHLKGPCRGIIIAKEITEDLLTAVRRVPGVTLYKYNLSVNVEEVSEEPRPWKRLKTS